MDTLISFDDLKAGARTLKKLVQAFTRAGSPVASTDIDPKTRRTSGVSYRQVQLSMTDNQVVLMMVKTTGDVFQVKVNGAVMPLKNQSDQVKAVAEIVKALDAGRAKFQAKLARQKVALPKGITTAAPKMEERLTQIASDLDGQIEQAKGRVNELRAELGEPVLDSAAEVVLDRAGAAELMSAIAERRVLKGVASSNADWKSGDWVKGDVVFVWNAELPRPYSAGQFPRVGNEGWSASAGDFDFTQATPEEIAQLEAIGKFPAPESVLDAVLDSAKKLTKKQAEVIDFIKTQINIDLAGAARYVKNKVIGIDVSDPDIAQKTRQIESLGLKFKRYRVEPNGHKAIALILTEDASLDGVTIPDAGELSAAARDVLSKIARLGPQEDGDIPSKSGRDELVSLGLVERADGDNLLTPKGQGCAATLDDVVPVELKDLGRSWLDFKLIDLTAAMQASAMALPARHRMAGTVRLALRDDDGAPMPVLGTVVAISFRSGKVLYSVAVPIAPMVEGGRQIMAIVPDVPSEWVEPVGTEGMISALDSVGYGAELKACSAAVLDAVDVPAASFEVQEVIEAQRIAGVVNGGAALDDATFSHALATLHIALETVETNYPINVAEGNLAQADLEERAAADFREAIHSLERTAAERASAGQAPA